MTTFPPTFSRERIDLRPAPAPQRGLVFAAWGALLGGGCSVLGAGAGPVALLGCVLLEEGDDQDLGPKALLVAGATMVGLAGLLKWGLLATVLSTLAGYLVGSRAGN